MEAVPWKETTLRTGPGYLGGLIVQPGTWQDTFLIQQQLKIFRALRTSEPQNQVIHPLF
jgi:hypothetical protein